MEWDYLMLFQLGNEEEVYQELIAHCQAPVFMEPSAVCNGSSASWMSIFSHKKLPGRADGEWFICVCDKKKLMRKVFLCRHPSAMVA